MDLNSIAKEFAITAHGTQMYGDKPYQVHLTHVHQILEQEGFGTDPVLSTAAWLHDVVEDTATPLSEITMKFGDEVADIVWRVTDEAGENRKERKLKTYPKIKGHRGATIVKLCDRIANVEASRSAPKKLLLYISEYPEFKNNLYISGIADSLWDRLEKTFCNQGEKGWKFRFWYSEIHGLIRQRSNAKTLLHPEIIENSAWVIGSAYIMDAITGMGEDRYSCGEWADEVALNQALDFAQKAGVDIFEVKSS